MKKKFMQKTDAKSGKTFFTADKKIWGKTAKRAYIALLILAGVVSTTAYLKNRAEIAETSKSAFDEAAWENAVKESGAADEVYPVFEEIPPSEQSEALEADSVIQLDEPEAEPEAEYTAEPEVIAVSAETVPVSEAEKSVFVRPSKGKVIRDFSGDELVYQSSTEDWRTHNGIDYAASAGDQVLAAADGTVKTVEKDDLWGITVEIEHSGGVISRYAGLQSLDFIQEGKSVKKGDIIGGAGTAGALETEDGVHIHFEIIKNGEYENPNFYFSDNV